MAGKIWNKEKEENQLRVAQQHLANERTYLAWIRTALAIIGIGFLTISYHLTIGQSHRVSDLLAVLISILSGVFGIGLIITAAVQYLRKRKQIQAQNFQSSYFFVIWGSLVLLIVILIAIAYILIQFMVM
ncbi:YidH family protein [Oceanobacillus rekensis]|uniref:YidH family protein n=1 Tax=Oceanobacillus rekensis TaxID=937927 RepID=UPI000B4546DF|nr:DUF202 domain-containing protein [Oceanobacillus rekensis]